MSREITLLVCSGEMSVTMLHLLRGRTMEILWVDRHIVNTNPLPFYLGF